MDYHSKKMRKKILFINPNLRVSRNFIDYPYFVNLGMLQMISFLKSRGYSVEAIDMFAQDDSTVRVKGDFIELGSKINIAEQIKEKDFDTIVILNSPFLKLFCSGKNNEIDSLLQNTKKIKPEARIILADCFISGMHYIDYDTKNIMRKYPLIDVICKHECENKLINVIEGNSDKNTTLFYRELDSLPLPDYKAVSLNNYTIFLKRVFSSGLSPFFDKKSMAIFTSRGCTYNCIFCSSKLNGCYYRQHSLNYIEKHIRILKETYGIEKIIILDDLPNISKERLERILELLNKSGLYYEFPNGLRADKISEKALQMMRGKISFLATSAESGSQSIVNKIIKKNLSLNSIENLAKLCNKNNIPLAVHFMIGLPQESYAEINKTLNFAIGLNEKYNATPLLQVATPLPGSKLFNSLKISNKQKEDLMNNYIEYFTSGSNLDFQKEKKIDLFIRNFKIRLNSKGTEKIIINTTYSCNNNCVFCAVGNWRNKKVSTEAHKKALERAYKKGIRMVDFDGGEPTLEKGILNLIKYAQSIGFTNISLITNGRMLSVRENAEKIVETGINNILFSVHGPDASIHDKITQVSGSFKQTMQGIKNILELKGKNKIGIGVNTTITKTNLPYITGLIKMMFSMGIKRVSIQFITPFGNAQESDTPSFSEINKILPDIIDKYSGKMNIQVINLPFCFLPGYEKYVTSDVLKLSRNMIFIGKKQQNLFKYLSSRRYKDNQCNSCTYSIICGGKWNFKG